MGSKCDRCDTVCFKSCQGVEDTDSPTSSESPPIILSSFYSFLGNFSPMTAVEQDIDYIIKVTEGGWRAYGSASFAGILIAILEWHIFMSSRTTPKSSVGSAKPTAQISSPWRHTCKKHTRIRFLLSVRSVRFGYRTPLHYSHTSSGMGTQTEAASLTDMQKNVQTVICSLHTE